MNTQKEEKKTYGILPIKILLAIPQIFLKLSPDQVDLSILEPYLAQKLTPEMNFVDYKRIGSDYLYAKDICVNNARVCEALSLYATGQLDKEMALSFLERAKMKYGITKVAKDGSETVEITDGKAKEYVEQDEEVLRYRRARDDWSVLAKYFSDQAYQFDKKHDWVKKNMDVEIKTDPYSGARQS